MEFKVREVSAENKSVQEVEQELVEKHEAELNEGEDTTSTEDVVVNESTEDVIAADEGQLVPKELGDNDVLEYIRNRYNKDISSMDDLLEEKSSNEEMPEDVAAYF